MKKMSLGDNKKITFQTEEARELQELVRTQIQTLQVDRTERNVLRKSDYEKILEKIGKKLAY